nr:response regulator [Alteromonas sp. C1M14]
MLIVEGDEIQAEVYQLSLSDDFVVSRVDNFTLAQKKLREDHFDIVLCDWEVGDHKATAITVNNRNSQSSLQAPVVVVVTEDAREASMISAYNGGVSYYITKPYKVIQFTETLLSIKNQILTLREMQADNIQTLKATKRALTRSAIFELGMDILSQGNHATDAREIARVTLSALRLHGIYAAIEFRNIRSPLYFDTDLTCCDDTTKKVFSVLRKQGGVYCFGRRAMINDDDISLLIKSVEHQDPAIFEVITTLGAKLLPSLNARYKCLLQEQALVDTQRDLTNIVQLGDKAHADVVKANMKLASSLTGSVTAAVKAGNLTAQQGEEVNQCIEGTISQALNNDNMTDFTALLHAVGERLEERLMELAIYHRDTSVEVDEETYRDLEYF